MNKLFFILLEKSLKDSCRYFPPRSCYGNGGTGFPLHYEKELEIIIQPNSFVTLRLGYSAYYFGSESVMMAIVGRPKLFADKQVKALDYILPNDMDEDITIKLFNYSDKFVTISNDIAIAILVVIPIFKTNTGIGLPKQIKNRHRKNLFKN